MLGKMAMDSDSQQQPAAQQQQKLILKGLKGHLRS